MQIFMSPLEKVYIDEVIEAASLCYQRGWCFGTAGNFSIRIKNSQMWQSPSSLSKGDLKRRFFVPIDVHLGEVLGREPQELLVPSLEMPIHRSIYRERPDARVVIHCHPPHLVKYSQLISSDQKNLVFYDAEMIKALGAKDYFDKLLCPFISNLSTMEMRGFMSLKGIIQDHREGHTANAIVLKGHGIYAWGASVKAALAVVEALEFLAHTEGVAPQSL